jgi:Eco57I restriction-modification methylase/N-6 DNA Methylase
VNKEIGKLERTRREWQKSSAADAARHIEDLNRSIEDQKRRLLEPYLSLKILDPAMGSGHFLVGAADFLSLAMATDPNLLQLDEMGGGDPQAFYKRLVVERCLYGVDVNPLAVELAKLSLWLHTVSRDKALTFLDHHLRCGNSLIGARVEDDLMKEPAQFNARGRRTNADSQQLVLGFTEALTATHLHYFLDTFRKIMEAPSGDAAMERQKDELYREMDYVRDKFRAVANCWLAPFFAIPVTPEQYERAIKTLRGANAERNILAQEIWFKNAQTAAQEKRFFHWELEFPDVFFEARGLKSRQERGFDAVVGNPPYGDILSDAEKRFLFSQGFEAGGSGNNDVFRFFLEQSTHLARQRRLISFIIPNPRLGEAKYRNYRKRISKLQYLRQNV